MSNLGNAIVYFACVATRLIIEVDGAQYGEIEARACDTARTAMLVEAGWRILRFRNSQIKTDMDSVIDTISAVIDGRRDP